LRFGQGFGLGGEWGGAALLAVENAPPGWRGRYGMFPQLGAPLGFLACNGLFLLLGALLSDEEFLHWGWRIPFLASALLVGIGLWVRLKLTETPEFAQALHEAPPPRVPAAEVFSRHFRALFGGTFAAITCFAIFYLSTTFALGYGTTKLGMDRQQFLVIQMVSILFLAIGILVSGYSFDRFGARPTLLTGFVGTMLASFLIAPLMSSGSALGIGAFLSLILFMMGLVYGPLGAWLPGLFPARVRYSGASIAFNGAGILGGALAPSIALELSKQGLHLVGYYLFAVAAISLVGLLSLRAKV
jgi:MFS family permease